MTLRLLSLLTLLVPSVLPAAPDIAVSIKPIHSLVTSIMQDVAQPELLFRGAVDPHHAHMTPSTRRQIATAELVIWVGPSLESTLAKSVAQSKTSSLVLLEAGLPELHDARNHHGKDPHIWLSPANARHILKVVTDALVNLDPGNGATYQQNLEHTLARVDTLSAKLDAQMTNDNRRYIAHHDAYQYFEKSFGLVGAGFIKNSHNDDPGFRIISQLGGMVEQGTVNCIVFDAQQRPRIIDSLGSTESTRYARISGEGTGFEPGADLWFDMMQQMGDRFHRCLQ